MVAYATRSRQGLFGSQRNPCLIPNQPITSASSQNQAAECARKHKPLCGAHIAFLLVILLFFMPANNYFTLVPNSPTPNPPNSPTPNPQPPALIPHFSTLSPKPSFVFLVACATRSRQGLFGSQRNPCLIPNQPITSASSQNQAAECAREHKPLRGAHTAFLLAIFLFPLPAHWWHSPHAPVKGCWVCACWWR